MTLEKIQKILRVTRIAVAAIELAVAVRALREKEEDK